jgi:hypothetical protein
VGRRGSGWDEVAGVHHGARRTHPGGPLIKTILIIIVVIVVVLFLLGKFRGGRR